MIIQNKHLFLSWLLFAAAKKMVTVVFAVLPSQRSKKKIKREENEQACSVGIASKKTC